MELKYNEKKAIQIAALLLKKSGGKMDMLRLTKLLYLVDREAFMRWGLPLTGDDYASMKYGMVLSETYSLSRRKFLQHRLWDNYISAPDNNYVMALIADPEDDELSENDVDLVNEIFETYKDKSTRFLIESVHHKLPEWKDVGNSSLIIPYDEVLGQSGVSEDQIETVINDIEDYSYFQQFS